MLGYIRAYKPEMKFKDYDIYKGIYCSLCKQIGKRYGLIARLTLSYDFTFFAIMRIAVRENCIKMNQSHCSFNPLKKCLDCEKNNFDIQYTADVSMLLMYHKLIDNINDSKFFKKLLYKLLLPFAKLKYKKAVRRCPEQAESLEKMTSNQAEIETQNSNIDKSAHQSALMLSELLIHNIECNDIDTLKKFGYCIGRWVYIIDAVDDCEDDIKTNSFNPLKTKHNDENYTEYCQELLDMTIGEAIRAFNKLKIYRFYDIIENILYDGTNCVVQKVLSNKGESDCEKSV